MPIKRQNPMFGWGPKVDPVVTDEISGEPCETCCQPTFHAGCKHCKGTGEEGDPTFRSLDDFDWSLEPVGVTNNSAEDMRDFCNRYKLLFYPPPLTAPFPCPTDIQYCDTYTVDCGSMNKAYSITGFSPGGSGVYRSPWCSHYGGTPAAPETILGEIAFRYKEACCWSGTIYGDKDEEPDYLCTGIVIGVCWYRLHDGSLKLGATAFTSWSADYGYAAKWAQGVIDLDEDDLGLVECDGFEETISLSPIWGCTQLAYGDPLAWHDPDPATRCSLPTGIKVVGVL